MANPLTTNHELDFEEALNSTLFQGFDKGYYIGMMSGTSLDGLDVVICQFDDTTCNQVSDFDTQSEAETHHKRINKLIATHSAEFPPNLRQVLLALCQPNDTHKLIDNLSNIDLELTKSPPQSELDWFGWASREYAEFASTVVNDLLAHSNIEADSILAIGCHGQTVRHRPHLRFSLQLVDPNIIAERTGISVVTDFRRRDMAVGGQGAPLVPAFHLANFTTPFKQNINSDKPSEPLVIVNLGGIANITLLSTDEIADGIGFDTGPANILLDAWYQFHVKHSDLLSKNPDFHPLYDKFGQWAQTGTVNPDLLNQLLSHDYFKQPAPKSTGREDFNLDWLNQQLNKVQQKQQQPLKPEDVQATLTLLTIKTLSEAIFKYTKPFAMNKGNLIVCGGGAYNAYLLEQLEKEMDAWKVTTSAEFGIEPTWVEAMAFAWLAQQTIMGNTGNLPTATGADKAVVLGQVCFA